MALISIHDCSSKSYFWWLWELPWWFNRGHAANIGDILLDFLALFRLVGGHILLVPNDSFCVWKLSVLWFMLVGGGDCSSVQLGHAHSKAAIDLNGGGTLYLVQNFTHIADWTYAANPTNWLECWWSPMQQIYQMWQMQPIDLNGGGDTVLSAKSSPCSKHSQLTWMVVGTQTTDLPHAANAANLPEYPHHHSSQLAASPFN